MKFGKSYVETIASPSFPEEWRKGAIEYKQLKKLINGVVTELESLGLGTDVLKELLEPHGDETASEDEEAEEIIADDPTSTAPEQDSERGSGLPIASLFPEMTQHLRFDVASSARSRSDRSPSPQSHEWDSSRRSSASAESTRRASVPAAAEWLENVPHRAHRESSDPSHDPPSEWPSMPPSEGASSWHQSQEKTAPPPPEEAGLDSIRRRLASVSVESGTPNPPDLDGEDATPRPSGTGGKSPRRTNKRDSSSSSTKSEIHDWGAHAWRERAGAPVWQRADEAQKAHPNGVPPRTQSPGHPNGAHPGFGKWVQGKGGRRARAEYELSGTPQHPVPRIHLHIESPETSEDEQEPVDGLPSIRELPPSPEVKSNPPSSTLAEQASGLPGLGPALVSEASSGPTAPKLARPSHTRMRRRDIYIPLTADTEFLDTLTRALQNLSTVQDAQRDAFIANTEDLASSIARAASPYASKSDMYVWREIFALWMEMQIFESEREKDRGELSVDESEARLKRFAEELAKRGWSTQPLEEEKASFHLVKRAAGANGPMKDLHSVRALEDFLKLNVALLDVKKFQRINVEAARKILKKHDKRTALTASDEFRGFIARQQGAKVALTAAAAAGVANLRPIMANASSTDLDNSLVPTHPSLAALLPSSTTGLLSASLPHILLSLLSTTLLPILPSIDDYSCAICTSVAWRPVRLNCSHLFCIRCLVKLQKQNKRDCPLCRAKNVVGEADEKNLDIATTNMLKAWFPREATDKEKENESDRRKEEMKEMGLEHEKCVIV